MPKIDKKTGERVYTIDYPQFNANHLYMQSVFDIIFALIEVAKDMRDYNDLRFDTLTQMLLHFILDETKQDTLLEERDNLIAEKTKGLSDMEEKNMAIHKVNIAMAGKMMKSLNKYMTFEEKLEIMRVGPRKEKVGEQN